MTNIAEQQFIEQLKQIIQAARSKVYSAVNFAQVEANWLIGQRIVEQEQHGETRAEYGKYIIQIASRELTAEFGKGYSETNLKNYRRFFLIFNDFQIRQAAPDELNSPIQQTAPAESPKVQTAYEQSGNGKKQLAILSWSHYERLMRVETPEIRQWICTKPQSRCGVIGLWTETLIRNIMSDCCCRR
jgi:hypothetical protein